MKFDIEWDDKQHIRAKIEGGPKKYNENMHIALIKAVADIHKEMVTAMKNTSIDKSTSYRRTKTKKGKKRKRAKYHHPSLPGYPPAKDVGHLIRSILIDDRYPEMEVGSILEDPPYPEYLEKGTKNMAARPVLEPTVDKLHDPIEHDLMEAIKASI